MWYLHPLVKKVYRVHSVDWIQYGASVTIGWQIMLIWDRIMRIIWEVDCAKRDIVRREITVKTSLKQISSSPIPCLIFDSLHSVDLECLTLQRVLHRQSQLWRIVCQNHLKYQFLTQQSAFTSHLSVIAGFFARSGINSRSANRSRRTGLGVHRRWLWSIRVHLPERLAGGFPRHHLKFGVCVPQCLIFLHY